MQVIIDLKGQFLNVNPSVMRVLGWSAEDMIGHSVFEFILSEDTLSSENALRHATEQALPTFENRYRHKDGSFRWISWVASPDGDLIYASGRDITAEKEQAAELATAQEALRQSQKMEAVGQLTGGLAHDFNNLLTGISGSLELLQTRVAQGLIKDVDRYVNAAQGAAKRAAALTHRLLAFSRRQTLEPKATDVNRLGLVAGMEELIGRTMGPEISVEPVTGIGLWAVCVDPSQLENALLNLCINARDAMPGGGKLSIETANRWLDERAARDRDMPPGQYVSLCVSDNGTGMPPEVVARAFAGCPGCASLRRILPVLCTVAVLEVDDGLTLIHPVPGRSDGFGIVGMNKVDECLASELLLSPAKCLGPSWVDPSKPAVIEIDDRKQMRADLPSHATFQRSFENLPFEVGI